MSEAGVEAKSQKICQKLLEEVNWTRLKKLSAYQPIETLNEVNISSFLVELSDRYPDIEVFKMRQRQKEIPDTKFDIILVPTLAFDKDYYRLGWGGGFYDRFLAVQPQAIKIGLCFQNGLVKDGIPHEPYDIPLDKVITEV